MGKCYFVSDLHLFANRSKASQYLDKIIRMAANAENFVLGGDIFDFRWARTKHHKHTTEKALSWLTYLLRSCPHCHFYFVLGNHDFHHLFIDQLDCLVVAVPNFSWNRYYFRLGCSVFLHGDAADRKSHNAASLAAAREEWLFARRRGPFMSRLYDVVVLTRLHKSTQLVYSKRVVARRLLAYLEEIGQGPAQGVKNVYFGHTHRRVRDYAYGGLVFHSGGASIKGLKFHILEATT
ncbi:MAG: metallophosphoesterase [Thermoguttaceae bacterium]